MCISMESAPVSAFCYHHKQLRQITYKKNGVILLSSSPRSSPWLYFGPVVKHHVMVEACGGAKTDGQETCQTEEETRVQ